MARALKNKLTQLKMTHEAELENIDWDIELNGLADYLGTTNIEGQVTHTFAEGKYLLVAVKNGCQPVFTKLNIVEPDPASATAYRGISE
jgi:hypothetical protein